MSLLLAVCLAVFLVAAPFAVWQLGGVGVPVALTAAVCCLLPGCLLFVLLNCGLSGSLVLPLLLVGMAARVGCCLMGVVVMRWVWEVRLEPALYVTAAFYCAALACETWLMMDSPAAGSFAAKRSSLDSVPLDAVPAGAVQPGELAVREAGVDVD